MDKHSRFWLHYIFHDERDTGQAFSGKLVGLLRERFGGEGFLEVPLLYREGQEPLLSAPLESEASLSPRILLIGIGTGAKVAYGVQRREGFHGSSLIAFCPPPGIPYETTEGPRAIFYGSKDGVYGTSLLQRLYAAKGERLPAQMYGLPFLIHGPSLALYAIAYLIGEYMESEDLSRAATGVSGR